MNVAISTWDDSIVYRPFGQQPARNRILVKRVIDNANLGRNALGASEAKVSSEKLANRLDRTTAGFLQLVRLRIKLHRLSELVPNWDGHDAEPPSKLSIQSAERTVSTAIARGLIPTDASPSVEGGTSVYFVKGTKYADFEFFNSGEILIGMSDRQNEPKIIEISHDEIPEMLEEFKQFLND